MFQPYCNKVFGVGLLQVTHVRTAMVQTYIVQNRVEIKVILICVAWDADPVDLPMIPRAEDNDRLCSVRMC